MREWGGSGRGCVLRFYWDDEETPSVEVPLTDFFAVGHDLFAPVNSLPRGGQSNIGAQLLLAHAVQAPRKSHDHQRVDRGRPPLLPNHIRRDPMSLKTPDTSTPSGGAPSPTDRIPITPSSTA